MSDKFETKEADITFDLWSDPKVQARRDALLDEELAKRGYPCNPKNAARAGWYAGIRLCQEVQLKTLNDVQKAKLAAFLHEAINGTGGRISVHGANDLLDEFIEEIKRVSALQP